MTKRKTRRADGAGEKPEDVASEPPPSGTRRPALRNPPEAAIEFCRTEFAGKRRVDCPVRRQFVRVPEGTTGQKSVLRQVIAGGGEVRLKLYLTALWWATSEPHNVDDVPASAWAQALGLPRYSTAGAKRVLDGVTWLTEHKLLLAARRRGAAAALRLLREDASGTAYHRPWVGHPRDKSDKPEIPPEDLYFQIPKEFWELGWVSVLSGPAVMCLCIQLDATWNWPGDGVTERKSPEDDRPATLRWYHFAEADRLNQWTVSEDTWRRGNHELIAWGLVERKARWSGGFTTRRQYFEYRVNLEAFGRSPLKVKPKPVRVTMPGGGGATP